MKHDECHITLGLIDGLVFFGFFFNYGSKKKDDKVYPNKIKNSYLYFSEKF